MFLLAGRVKLLASPYDMAKSSLDMLLLAERCRLPRLRAKCEAFLAMNFNSLKMHPQARSLPLMRMAVSPRVSRSFGVLAHIGSGN